MYDIITVGSNTLDVFVKTDSELIKIKTSKSVEELIAYPLGSKIIIKDLRFLIGGGGTNTAVSFSRLGLRTAYLGKIGKDENGLKIFKLLKDEKIDFIGTLGHMSGYSIILDSIENDRTILTCKGCNDMMTYKEVHENKLKTDWFYFTSMMGKSFEMLKKLAEYAGKHDIKVAFNASCYLAEKGFTHLKRVLDNTKVFILNTEEAQDLVGKGSISDMARKLKQPQIELVVLTDGNKGAYCYDGKILYSIKPKKIKVKETTGAGDAFGSSFVAGISKKKSIEDALRMGMINAESVIGNYGAKNILLSKTAMARKLKSDRRPVKKKKL